MWLDFDYCGISHFSDQSNGLSKTIALYGILPCVPCGFVTNTQINVLLKILAVIHRINLYGVTHLNQT
jgi:hypothetical protein